LVVTPLEVLGPDLLARVKQLYPLFRFRIDSGGAIKFETVTRRASQTQIVERCCAASGSRPNVIDLTQLATQPF
jgi:hypothetical protein